MAAKRHYARVDSGTRFRTLALRTVYTSAVFAVGVVVGYIAPDELPERFRPTGSESPQGSVEVEVSAVPREVYTVDNEMTRRREEARPGAAGGATALAPGSVEAGPSDAPGNAAVAPAGAPTATVAAVAAPVTAAATPSTSNARGIGETAAAIPSSTPRVVARSGDADDVTATSTVANNRAVVPPPRPTAAPVAAPVVDDAPPRVVRRAVASSPGEHPFEVEVLPASTEGAAQTASARLNATGLDSHTVTSSDGRHRVVIRGRGDAAEIERQRRIAERVLAGEL